MQSESKAWDSIQFLRHDVDVDGQSDLVSCDSLNEKKLSSVFFNFDGLSQQKISKSALRNWKIAIISRKRL